MLNWFRKKDDTNSILLQQIAESNKKLQEKVNQLQNTISNLQSEIKQKDNFIAELQNKIIDNNRTLSDEQLAVISLLENTNTNYFITGKAGTGKSTVLKYFVDNTNKKVVTLAPTGVAANIVNGRTIHSFFGLGPVFQDVTNPAAVHSEMNADQKLIEELDTIIIDEVSMVRSDVMDMIDHKLRATRNNRSPYGGVQIILFGDLFQLAPVVKGDEGALIIKKYGTPYFFGAPSAKNFTVCGLKKVFRQTDQYFISILNKIRTGDVTQNDLDGLYTRCKHNTFNDNTETYIVPTNKKVNMINKEKMSLLTTKEYTYTAICEGDATEEDTPATSIVTLKIGATVMMLCNDPNKCFINGTLAKVVELARDMIKVSIKGVGIINVDQYTWPKYKYVYNEEEDKIETEQTGSFTQYPLKPAYAITVHKSQGQTYEHAVIDYSDGGAFAPGQTYVALSRCKSLDGVRLQVPIRVEDIKVSNEIISYMKPRFVPVLQYIKDRL